jgi:hypothetical protein
MWLCVDDAHYFFAKNLTWEADPSLMSRTNANSTSPLTQLKALGRCVSAVGRNLCNWLSRTASSLLASRNRKTNGLYLLYTEHTGKTGLRNVKTALDQRFPGYTLDLKALGRYKRTSENSLIAHVLTHDRGAVRRAAAEICELNDQESVLCVELPVTWAEFVTRGSKPKKKSLGMKRVGMARARRTRWARTGRKRVS